MTRVLLVHQPTDGGVGRHVADLCQGLSELGYEVIACGPTAVSGVSPSCPHVRLELARAVSARADLQMLTRLAAIVRDVRPDVVHAHSSKAGALARLARFARPRVPVVYTPHGYSFAGFFTRGIERAAYRQAERALAPLASRVLCVCAAEGRLAETIGSPRRVRVVHNGIDLPHDGETDRRMAALAARGPVLCTLTQLRPGKGLETLIDAVPGLLARNGEIQVAIWGDGPGLEALQGRAQQRGVGHAVHFLGPTPDPVSVLRAATVFVLPSWAEAFPYAILEAMSVGLPIVATDVGGVGEAVRDQIDGLLVPSRDQRALDGAIWSLLADPSLAARTGAAARSRVGELFTRKRMTDGVARVYDEVRS